MTRVRSRTSGAIVLLALSATAGRVAAQGTLPKDAVWTLEGSSGGYCIWYLADPVLARELVPSSTALLPAGSGSDLPAVLASTIREEPKYSQWIPGTICVGFYQRITSEGRTIAEAKPNRPMLMIATNSLAAQGAHGVPAANQYLIDFMTNDHAISSAADRAGVEMADIEMTSRSRLVGEDPTVTLSFGGIAISWSGHAVADSGVGKTRSVSFGYGGPKSASWQVTSESAPKSSRLIVAVLWVEGKNSLAKVLKASPARPIGPEMRGGAATLTFHAVTKK
jgi:hypothetical protein